MNIYTDNIWLFTWVHIIWWTRSPRPHTRCWLRSTSTCLGVIVTVDEAYVINQRFPAPLWNVCGPSHAYIAWRQFLNRPLQHRAITRLCGSVHVNKRIECLRGFQCSWFVVWFKGYDSKRQYLTENMYRTKVQEWWKV